MHDKISEKLPSIKQITIGSRDSKLALVQSHYIRDLLLSKHPDLEISIKEIKTQGDKILDVALAKIGDKGLFTKELEHELLEGTIDLAVHSAKDMPTKLPPELEIIAFTKREDIRDVVCLSATTQAKTLQEAKVIASSSLRRVAQLKALYPEKTFVDMRGNLQTRFKKLDDPINQIDAMILAAAGLNRLDMQSRINEYLDPDLILPAVGQGALAIEIKSDSKFKEVFKEALNNSSDEILLLAERAMLRELEGGCQIPIGVNAKLLNDQIEITGIVLSLDGSQSIKETIIENIQNPEATGIKLAQRLINKGAREILNTIRVG
jgi:hydroxymethylbilane synthase